MRALPIYEKVLFTDNIKKFFFEKTHHCKNTIHSSLHPEYKMLNETKQNNILNIFIYKYYYTYYKTNIYKFQYLVPVSGARTFPNVEIKKR